MHAQSDGHVLGIFVGHLSNEEARVLQCMAVDVNVQSEIHTEAPASSSMK